MLADCTGGAWSLGGATTSIGSSKELGGKARDYLKKGIWGPERIVRRAQDADPAEPHPPRWAHVDASRLPGLQGTEKVSTTSSSKGIWRS